MSADMMVLMSSLISFMAFFLAHCLVFRLFKTEKVFKGIMGMAVSGIIFNFISMITLGIANGAFNSLTVGLVFCLLMGLSSLVYGLMVFVYILCIFGPYETSIRMRLIRELDQAGAKGLTEQELLLKYNAAMILTIRLSRLIGAGDLVLANDQYRVRQNRNMFFVIDVVAWQLQQWIDHKPKG